MKVLLLLVIINMLFANLAVSQNCKLENFHYFSIKQNLHEFSEDSIRFLVSGNLQKKKPIVVYVHGSGNYPLVTFEDSDSTFYMSPLHDIIKEHNNDYHFVVISKPGVPICMPTNTPFPWNLDTITISKTFWECDMLEYHANATKEVLKFIRQQDFADNSKIYLSGHSQGANVVAKVAAENPDLITKVAYMSSSLFGRLTQDVMQLYIDVYFNKTLTHKELVEQLDSNVYNRLNNHIDWKNYINYTNDVEKSYFPYHSALSNYSFNRELSIFNLLKIKIPLLVVYGTADIKCADISLLPLFLFDTDVNYTIKAYPNYDHGYSLVGEDRKIINGEFHFGDVFNDVLKWFGE